MRNYNLLDFVIIGAQKAATTFLQRCLAEHPKVFMPKDETPFFESPLYELNNITFLENIFKGKENKLKGIKRPSYLGKPEVPARIINHLPEAKIIVVLRNPVERVKAAYFHYIKYGFLPPIDINNGIHLLFDPHFISKYQRASEIIEFGFYYKYLSKYEYFVNKGHLLVLLFDDIKKDKLNQVQKCFKFLNINDNYIPKSLNTKPQTVIYNISYLKFIAKRDRLIFNCFPNFKDREKIIKGVKTFFDRIDNKISRNIKYNNKYSLSYENEIMLYNIYKRDIAELEKYINKDLSIWRVD